MKPKTGESKWKGKFVEITQNGSDWDAGWTVISDQNGVACVQRGLDFLEVPISRIRLPKADKASVADAIRQHVITKCFESARASGAKEVTVRAGDIHKELNYKNRMPAVCSVLGSKRLETEARVHRTSTNGPHNSSTTCFTYTIL